MRVGQPAFTAGELAPSLAARVDMAKYGSGAALLENFIVHAQGGVSNRAGTDIVGEVVDSARKTRTIPFIFSNEQSYALEFGHQTLRIVMDGAYVLEANKAITAATKTNPVRLTVTGHGWITGDDVFVSGVVGMTELNGRRFEVSVVDANTADLVGIDGTAYGTYTSGGTGARYYTVATPYTEDEVFDLSYKQNFDVLFLSHEHHAPRKLTRSDHASWALAVANFAATALPPEGIVVTPKTVGSSKYAYTVVAVGNDGKESLAGLKSVPYSITGATKANPVVVTLDITTAPGILMITHDYPTRITTSTAHGLTTDQLVYLKDVYFNNGASSYKASWSDKYYKVRVIDPTHYDILVDSSTDGPTFVSAIMYRTSTDELDSGDEIFIDSVGGMTELNGRRFTVTKLTPNTYELDEEDGTNHGTYTSGGNAYPTFGLVVNAAELSSTNYLDISWTHLDPRPLEYRVYRRQNGIFGYVGATKQNTFRDTNFAPVTSSPPPNYLPVFTTPSEYPAAVGIHDQRSLWGGADASPLGMTLSQTGILESMLQAHPIRPDDAFEYTFTLGVMGRVYGFESLGDLIVLTSGGVIVVGSGDELALAPDAFQIKKILNVGAARLPGLKIGDTMLFVQEHGTRVLDLAYRFESDSFGGNDRSVLARHLFEGHQIIDWAYSAEPHSLVWAVRDDGVLLTMSYLRDHDVWAWTHHVTDGAFESVCVIPGAFEDDVYFVVRRTVDGVERRFVEKLHTRRWTAVEDAYFVDCGLSYSGAAVTTIGGLWHLEGKSVVAFADGNVHPARTVQNGEITLQHAASKVHVGLAYTGKGKSLRPEIPGSTLQGRKKSIKEVVFRVERTRGLRVGPAFDKLVEAKMREAEAWGDPISLLDGDIPVTLDSSWNTDGQVCWEVTEPIPVTILGLWPEVIVGG